MRTNPGLVAPQRDDIPQPISSIAPAPQRDDIPQPISSIAPAPQRDDIPQPISSAAPAPQRDDIPQPISSTAPAPQRDDKRTDKPPKHRGWYWPNYLPHRDHPGLLQSITYRLIDSLPRRVVMQLDAKLRAQPLELQDPALRKRVNDWLDAGYGCCILRHPEAAACVVDTWQRFNGERYDLIAWVVMPNHVHVLVRVYPGALLGTILQSWKSYTGRRIRKVLDQQRHTAGLEPWPYKGVWRREYWDRFIRDQRHFDNVVAYIHQNPVKAGLVLRAEDWLWSSAREFTAT